MKLHELRPAKGATHKDKRIGRGDGSGHGGTSTKGTKGGQSRAGYKRKMAHEGGQMPIQRRIPKRGFKNPDRVEYQVVNLSKIQGLPANTVVDRAWLEEHRMVRRPGPVKLLAGGEVKVALTVKVDAVSASAKQ